MPTDLSTDIVRTSAQAGRLVLWEESARDGTQGKTLMNAGFRIRLARKQGQIFGVHGARHVVFAAGFPAVCAEEFEVTRRVALEVDGAVSPAAVCRATAADVRQAVAAVHAAARRRVMIVVPASDLLADVMLHRTARAMLALAPELVDEAHAADRTAGGVAGTLSVDVCLADAPRADPVLLAELAERVTAAGAGAAAMFGPDIPILDADTITSDAITAGTASAGARTGATTMLRLGADGTLGLVRHGAHDRPHGPDGSAARPVVDYLTDVQARFRATTTLLACSYEAAPSIDHDHGL